MGGQNGTDRLIASLAATSHGVVTRALLLRRGVTRRQLERRLARGTLIRVHRGVYRVGHAAPSVEASYLAAVLACGEDALLGGRAAAWLQRLLGGPPPAPRVWARGAARVPGVVVRRARDVAGWERASYRGVPCTSVARTLLDLAAGLPLDDLALAAHRAWTENRVGGEQVAAILARHPKAPGRAKLRAVALGEAPVTIGELERRFRRRLREAGLPMPDQSNRVVGSFRVDCRWVTERLTVELDSFGFHNSRVAWERDHRRAREAYARGDEHRRYTYADVLEDPAAMLAELAGLLIRPAQTTASVVRTGRNERRGPT